MQALWSLLLLVLCFNYVGAAKLVSDLYNYMTSANPQLMPTMIREQEQDLWEPEPVDKYLQLVQGMEKLQLEGPTLRQLTSLTRKEMARLADWAFQIVGGSSLEDFTAINPFTYVSNNAIPGYIVIVLRPLLLSADMKEDELRLLYHTFANRKYLELDNFLSRVETLSQQSVLLVGATDAGLAATYLALRLMRKNEVIAPLGKWTNCLGQIQVITMNSPAPLTPNAVQMYRLPQSNMLDFALSSPNKEFTYAGVLQLCKPPSMLQDIAQVNNHSYLKGYFQGQELNTFNIETHFNQYFTIPTFQRLAERLATQQMKARQGTVAASADFAFVGDIYHRQDLDSCTNALQGRLQQVLISKLFEGNGFTMRHQLEGNWALSAQVTCSRDKFAVDAKSVVNEGPAKFKVTCAFVGHRGVREFASYWLSIDQPSIIPQSSVSSGDEKEKSSHESAVSSHSPSEKRLYPSLGQSDQSDHERSSQKPLSNSAARIPHIRSHTGALDACLIALFEMQPELRIFSPFHKESSNVPLTFQVWPFAQRTCNAMLVPSQALYDLYEEDRSSFVALLSSPAILNPLECQRGTLPPTISGEELGNSSEYWPLFAAYARDYLQSDLFSVEQLVTDYTFDRDADSAAFQQKLFAILHSNFGRDIVVNQYDCTKPEVLWHSDHFCPKMCRVLIDSNFCKRVYIAETGLKMSLRGESSIHQSLDDTKRQWEILFGIKKNFSDRSTIILKLKSSDLCNKHAGKIFYAAIFLEGEIHAAHASHLLSGGEG